MNDHAWRERIPAFVLGALDPEDRSAFAEHLDACPRCREEVRAYREVVAGLASLAPAASRSPEPRPHMPEEAGEARRAAGGREGVPPASPARPKPVTEPPAGPGALRLPGPRSGGGDGLRAPTAIAWLVAAAGLVATIVAGAAYWEARGAGEDLRLDYEQARARIEQLDRARAERDSMLATLRGGELRIATLASTEREPRVRLFWNPRRGRLLITAFDLPPAPAGRTYQLWGLAPDRDPVDLGTFQTERGGIAIAVHELRRTDAFERSAVTEEPAGGSPHPTSTQFLVGSWESGAE